MADSLGAESLFTSLLSRLGMSGRQDTSATNAQDTSAMNGLDTTAETSYHVYPPSRPFINSDYQRPSARPVVSFPESNRDGVLSALRNLQERMRGLEVERKDAENNLRSLASETEAYRSSLHDRPHPRAHGSARAQSPGHSPRAARHSPRHTDHPPPPSVVPNGVGNTRPRARELESQLSSAETRCQLLEKQLDYMRKMVQGAEQDRVDAVKKAEALQQQQQQQQTEHNDPSPLTPDYRGQLDRISELEKDHLRLTATQTLAESKIKELENKLKQERDHRRQLQERALDLESAAVSHQILLNTAPASDKGPPDSRGGGRGKKPPPAKKKKKVISRKQVPVKSEPTKHFRLNLADIPFVAGKSTGPSHAVGANVQKVLALMKSHNLALCSSLYNGHCQEGEGGRCVSPSSLSSSSSSMGADQDLTELLQQLQDEFGNLSCEHQELLRQLQEERNPQVKGDIEGELELVLHRMETKGHQISRVRQHQQKLEDTAKRQTKHSKKGDPVPRPSSAMGRLQATHRHHHPPHSTDPATRHARPRSSSRQNRDHRYTDLVPPTLNVLRDMRKLQSTLRQDDVCWE